MLLQGFVPQDIFPFNKSALLPAPESQTLSKFNPKSLCKGTKLKFIPVYSPVQSNPMPPSSPPLYNFTEEEVALSLKGMKKHTILPMIKIQLLAQTEGY